MKNKKPQLIRFLESLTAIIFVVMFSAVSLQIIARNLFEFPVIWTEELARFLYVWLTFLGAIIITHDNEHIKVEIISDSLPLKLRKPLAILVDILAAIYCLIVFKGGLTLVQINTRAPLSTLPHLLTYAHLYLVVPIAMGSMFCLFIAHIWSTSREILRECISQNTEG